ITDPWTNSAAVAQAVGIYISGDYNTGSVSATSVVRGTKVATYVLTSAVKVAPTAHNAVSVTP
ncbi:MAG: hypothetical protein M3T56_19550, partial [Chloroflexota bacterium]|nr:hypothetical protein [Chloroflexota bacterium]